jgi:hypothetical protein
MASNPVQVNCPEGEWTKVATDVTTGNIKKLSVAPAKYLETYRLTGEAAPTSSFEGAEVFTVQNPGDISADAGIDVYVMAVGSDGKVRADT